MKREDVMKLKELVEKIVKNTVDELTGGCEEKTTKFDEMYHFGEVTAKLSSVLSNEELAIIIRPDNMEEFTEDVIRNFFDSLILAIPSCTIAFMNPKENKMHYVKCTNKHPEDLSEEKISVEDSEKEEENGEMKFGFIPSDEPSIGEMIQDIIDNRSDEVNWEFTIKNY